MFRKKEKTWTFERYTIIKKTTTNNWIFHKYMTPKSNNWIWFKRSEVWFFEVIISIYWVYMFAIVAGQSHMRAREHTGLSHQFLLKLAKKEKKQQQKKNLSLCVIFNVLACHIQSLSSVQIFATRVLYADIQQCVGAYVCVCMCDVYHVNRARFHTFSVSV